MVIGNTGTAKPRRWLVIKGACEQIAQSTYKQYSLGGIRMHTTRRKFLKATAAAVAASTLPAPAVLAQSAVELKMASFVPPTHSIWAKVLLPWAKKVEEASGGKLKIVGYPSMQLGGKAPEL